jgi:hypothetical protein
MDLLVVRLTDCNRLDMPRKTSQSQSRGRSDSSVGRKATASRATGVRKKNSAPAKPQGKTKSSARSAAKRPASGKLSKTTTDHDEIRQWAESRAAHPARVKSTGRKGSDTGIIRLDFPGFSGQDSLEEISWDEFFESFDENGLALVYQEKTAAGKPSNFNKLVKREPE